MKRTRGLNISRTYLTSRFFGLFAYLTYEVFRKVRHRVTVTPTIKVTAMIVINKVIYTARWLRFDARRMTFCCRRRGGRRCGGR